MRAVSAILAGILVVVAPLGAEARVLKGPSKPAEYPPASFKGRDYVDSKGCMFIRAGYGGNVTWVPRVAQDRNVICGQTPSLSASARTTTTAPQTATSQPVQPQAVAAATPTTRPTRKRAAFDWNTFWFGTPRTRKTVEAPQIEVASAPAVVQSQPVAAPSQTSPRKYHTSYGAYGANPRAVRTGPQAVHPGDWVRQQQGYTVASLQPGYQPQTTRGQVYVPEGYKSLITANVQPVTRGHGTAEGEAAMDLIWTQTMPRRLIDTTTGRDVTKLYPRIRYPYTTLSTRSYASATPAAPSTRTRNRDEASPINMNKITEIEDTSASTDIGSVAPVTPDTGGRYVQVATFGVPANASRTMARFGAAGLPSDARAFRRGGKNYQIVVLGPFGDQASLNAALSAARGAGFGDAFLTD